MGTTSVVQHASSASSAAILILNGMASKYEGRATVTCGVCRRAQFNKGQDHCIACHAKFLIALEPLSDWDAKKRDQAQIEMNTGERICVRLRDLRRLLGISQPELAEASDCVRTHISKYENGRIIPTIASLSRLAGAMNITMAELLDESLFAEQLALISLLRSPGDGELMRALLLSLPRLGKHSRAFLLNAAGFIKSSPSPLVPPPV
jgi:transcriptional regulator with XRE-family HTH domain